MGQVEQIRSKGKFSDWNGDSKFMVKLVDFGFAREDASRMRTSICGTPNYMSPELLLKKQHHGKPADVWALGVVLFYIMAKKFPYYARSEEDLISKVHQSMPDTLSIRLEVPAAAELLDRIFLYDPSLRSTISDILASDFLNC